MVTRTGAKDPLGPLEFILSLAVWLVGVSMVLAVVFAVAGAHMSLGALGDEMPCMMVPQGGVVMHDDGHTTPPIEGLRSGVQVAFPESFRVCTTTPSAVDRALLTGPVALDLCWSLGFLLLARSIVRRARRSGLFTRDLARMTEQLGWYVLLGWVAVNVLSAIMHAVVASQWINDYPALPAIPLYLTGSWPIVIGGCGIITVGRILRQAVPLREDVEATV